MKIQISDVKRLAREALKGKLGMALGGLAVVFFLNLLASMLTSNLFVGNTLFDFFLGQVFLFVLSLITGIVSAGLSYLYLKLARGQEASVSDVFFFFKNKPDRVIVAGFVIALITEICTLPYYIYAYTAAPVTTMEEQLTWAVTTLLLLGGTAALGQLLTIPFAMAFFLLADEPEDSGIEVLKKSVRMMKRHYMEYLLLEVSFIPWLILSVFTLYIALIWALPYLNMSETVFYRMLRGEYIIPDLSDYHNPEKTNPVLLRNPPAGDIYGADDWLPQEKSGEEPEKDPKEETKGEIEE